MSYGSSVGKASHSVPPRAAVLRRNKQAIFSNALKIIVRDDGAEDERGNVAP